MASFIADKIVMDGLTFDDVLLIPAYSEVLPKTVELKTRFSRNIELNVPFVTAAMDTVTESQMAIAIAREGGIGVIHKNMSIEDQARQVAIVKRAENGMIYDPITIPLGSTVAQALDIMSEYHIGGIPVVDEGNRLVGIVTNRDLRFERQLNRPVDEVMSKDHLVTTHQQTDLMAASEILQRNKIEKLPVVDKDNRLIGLITYKDITKAKDKPMACKDEKGRLRVAAGVGVTADTLDRMQALVDAGADAIVIDTAHGHSKSVIEKLVEAKKMFPQIDIVVGNVATGEAAKMLADDGIRLPFVWNSSGYERVETLEEYSDLCDWALFDLRYSRNETAVAASAAPGYVEHARAAVKCAWGRTRLIVRVLVLPGHAEEAVENLAWIATELSSEVPVSVMSQYTPVYEALSRPPFDRRVTADEYAEVSEAAADFGFENGWVQDLSSADPSLDLLGENMKSGHGTVGCKDK